MDGIALIIDAALLFYCCASVLYLWSILGGTKCIRRFSSIAALVGLAFHGAAIVDIGIRLGRAPITNLFESLIVLSWALVAIYLVMERKYRITALGAFAAILSLCMLAVASTIPNSVNSALVPALRSHWSVIHVATCLVSYASFALAFGAALCYVLQAHILKTKRITALQSRLPSLDVADSLAYKMVSFGFPLLTLGIVTGALWAQSAWGSYWRWDPKETWSLITWLIYAAYLHVRIVSHWRGKWANRLLVVGFLCVIVTYLGVNFFASGLHKYNW
jgi:cytochrome c-type biogenesis protein CcsB